MVTNTKRRIFGGIIILLNFFIISAYNIDGLTLLILAISIILLFRLGFFSSFMKDKE